MEIAPAERLPLRNQYFCIAEDGSHVLANCVTCEHFLRAVGETNLLMLSEPPDCDVRHRPSNLHYIPRSRIPELLQGDIYSLGDFQWVDFGQEDALDDLTSQEIARLLYLGHKWEPLDSPFIDRLGSRFAYLAHDDGWLLKLYCREANGIRTVLSKLIPTALSIEHTGTAHPDLPEVVAQELVELARGGLQLGYDLFSLQGAVEVHRVGRYEDMDYVENHSSELRRSADVSKLLRLSGSSWTLSA